MQIERRLYTVKMNRSGEVHTFWTQASSELEALHNCITKLEGKLRMRRGSLRSKYNGDIANYTIEVKSESKDNG